MTGIDQQGHGRQETLILARTMLESRRRREGIDVLPGGMAREVACHVAAGMNIQGEDLEWVIRELEAEHSVTVDEVRMIVPDDAGLPWKVGVGALQQDLHTYLARQGMGPRVIQSLEDSTGAILSRCGNPAEPGPWQRRGLVAGQVQSGKTTSYSGLIAGAIEEGYRNIVIFTGRTNDLRNQTQERIDEAIVGQESSLARSGVSARVSRGRGRQPVTPRPVTMERPRVLGVGHIRSERRPGETWVPGQLPLLSLTSQDHRSGGTNGDFNRNRADHNNLSGRAITLAVSKKHASVIRNLTNWLRSSGRIDEGPLLVIDDEADDASIDVSADESPSTINREIRKLLHAAHQATYVAYTATPYANVMIDPDTESETLGSDLFPGDFIALLDAPENYMGARKFFLEPEQGRQHFVEVRDSEGWIERGEVYGPLPGSLLRAVQEFVVVAATRRARAQSSGTTHSHASMLVHCDVHVSVQSQIVGELADLIPAMRDGWKFPVSGSSVRDAIQSRWTGKGDDPGIGETQDESLALTWEQVEPHIAGVLDDLDVQELNSSTKQNLDYRRAAREGKALTVIAVGGHKLSRGLTLEGLSTSYLLRITKLYDTLMQMGRWFGYRRGYEDLCRVHTTASVFRNFLLVEEADAQLRDELKELQELGTTPREVGMRMRHNPGMQITSSAKLRDTTVQRSGWGGRTIELTWFRREDAVENSRIAGAFIDGLGTPLLEGKHAIWSDVSIDSVMELLRKHREPVPDADGVRVGRAEDAQRHIDIAQSIDMRKLARWRVVLSGADPDSSDRVGAFGIERRKRQGVGLGDIRIKIVSDPKDERFGVGANSSGSRAEMKQPRDRNQGLLIGYPLMVEHRNGSGEEETSTFTWVVSFPPDAEIKSAEYVLSVRAQEEFL